MGSPEPDMRFVRHVAKDKTINRAALAVERAFAEERDIGLEGLTSLFPCSTFIRVSRRADSSLFVTDDLLRKRNKFALTVVGYDTSFTAGCIDARGLMQYETTAAKPMIVSAEPIICRGDGIGAVIVGSTRPLDVHEQESLASLADALANVLDEMVLSESMIQLLDWRERDQSFCGRELEFQDLPCVDMATSLRPLVVWSQGTGGEGKRVSFDTCATKREEDHRHAGGDVWGSGALKETCACSKVVEVGDVGNIGKFGKIGEVEVTVDDHELPDEFSIRVFGLAWLYLSAVIVGRIFAEGGMLIVPAVVALLALVSGVGSLIVLFPGIRKQVFGNRADHAVEKGLVQSSKLSTAAAMIIAATNALTERNS